MLSLGIHVSLLHNDYFCRCCRPSHNLFFVPFVIGVAMILGGLGYLIHWKGFRVTPIPVINLFLGTSMFMW